MPSKRTLTNDKKTELFTISKEWVTFFGMKGVAKRLKTTVHMIKQAAKEDKELANLIEKEWAQKLK